MPNIQPPQFSAPHTWRGFLIRVATIAIAALIVLGAYDFFEYLHDPHPVRRTIPYDREQPQPPNDDSP